MALRANLLDDSTYGLGYNVRNGGSVATGNAMAIYRLEAMIVSRGHGRSAVDVSAYCCGKDFVDKRTGKTHRYSDKEGVLKTMVLAPLGAPDWVNDPETLWNVVEAGEKRKDAQTARHFLLTLPRELSHEQHVQLVVEWTQRELVDKGMVAQVTFHDLGDGNPHSDVLCTMRKMVDGKFEATKSREWNKKDLLRHWRKSWCDAENAALEKAGCPERVDHRSLIDRGIDRVPEPKLGTAATAMRARGLFPWRWKLIRSLRMENLTKPWKMAIQKFGEIREKGMGSSWWERSLESASRTRDAVRDTVLDSWHRFTNSPHQDMDKSPSRDHGPDMSR